MALKDAEGTLGAMDEERGSCDVTCHVRLLRRQTVAAIARRRSDFLRWRGVDFLGELVGDKGRYPMTDSRMAPLIAGQSVRAIMQGSIGRTYV